MLPTDAAAVTHRSTAESAEKLSHIDQNWRSLIRTMLALGEDVPPQYEQLVLPTDDGRASTPKSARVGPGEHVAYDPEDDALDHTSFAIKFDQAGEIENARVAFESAVRWDRSGHSLVNLGVFEMRQRRFDEALAAMWEAKTGHSTADAAEHIDENWRGLMQTMSALGVDVPAKYQGDAPARVGGREGPSILTRKAGARVDSSI